MANEKDVSEEFFGKMFQIDPIDRVLLQILRWNPHVKASFNRELGVWDFYGKKGESFLPPNTCTYEKPKLILHNGDGTSTLVGIFHVS